MFCLLQSLSLFTDFVQQMSLYHWKYLFLKCKRCFLIQIPCAICSNFPGSSLGLTSSSVTTGEVFLNWPKFQLVFREAQKTEGAVCFFKQSWKTELAELTAASVGAGLYVSEFSSFLLFLWSSNWWKGRSHSAFWQGSCLPFLLNTGSCLQLI